MKLYPAYKKQFNILILVLLLLIVPTLFSHAQTAQNASDIQNQIDQKNSDIAILEQEIATYQAQLDTLGTQKNSLSQSLSEIEVTRKKLNASIKITQNKINQTNLQIQALNGDISMKESAIKNNLNSITEDIKNSNELDQNNFLENLLSADDFSSAWNDIDNRITVQNKIREEITALQKTKSELENVKQTKINTKNQQAQLKSVLSDQQKIVVQNANDKTKLLNQTKNSETTYQKLLKDRIAKRDAFEKELNDYEAQLQFVLDPSKLPTSGVLSWPLDKVFVTQLFGKTVDSKRLYASGTHNGVDFRASTGTPVLAMADGVVLGTGNTDLTCYGASFGKFVFIQYNNGLSSTFGHLSLIKSKVGDKVSRGEIVGYSGSTGHVTGPHLHVSLYASQAVKMDSKPSAACGGRIYTLPVAPVNAYLDALYYLPPYKINSSLLNNKTLE